MFASVTLLICICGQYGSQYIFFCLCICIVHSVFLQCVYCVDWFSLCICIRIFAIDIPYPYPYFGDSSALRIRIPYPYFGASSVFRIRIPYPYLKSGRLKPCHMLQITH